MEADPGLQSFTLPVGGKSKAQGGQGIFYDEEKDESVVVWIDIDIKDRVSIIRQLEAEGARIATDHGSPTTHLLILSPRSVRLFDMYCHPDWLTPLSKRYYYAYARRKARKGEAVVHPWMEKIMLKAWWVSRCFEAGAFLGEMDDWGGCRAGGPPRESTQKSPLLSPGKANRPLPPQSLPDTCVPEERVCSENEQFDQAVGDEAVQPAPLKVPLVDEPTEGRIEDENVQMEEDSIDLSIPTLEMNSAATDNAPLSAEDVDMEGAMEVDATPETKPMPGENQAVLGPTTTSEATTDAVQPSPAASRSPERRSLGPPVAVETGEAQQNLHEDQPLSPVTIGTRGNGTDDPEQDEQFEEEEEEEVEEVEEVESPRKPEPSSAVSQERQRSVSNLSLDETHDPVATASKDIDRTISTVLSEAVVEPPPILSDVKIWVDLKVPGRISLIRQIQKAGGKISVDFPSATHILVYDYARNKDRWDPIVNNGSWTGVSFVNVQWATACMDRGLRLPETDYLINNSSSDKSRPSQSTARDNEVKPRRGGQQGGGVVRMTTEELADIIAKETAAHRGYSIAALSEYLYDEYGTYSRQYWGTSISDYRKGSGRFASLVHEREIKALEGEVEAGGPSRAAHHPSRSKRARASEQSESPIRVSRPRAAKRIKIEEPDDQGQNMDEGIREEEIKEDYAASPIRETQDSSLVSSAARGTFGGDRLAESLTKAYEFFIETKCKRSKVSSRSGQAITLIMQTSGLKDRELWRDCYANFHNSHVAGEFTDEVLSRILDEELPSSLTKPQRVRAIFTLIAKYGIYDLNGWRELASRRDQKSPLLPLPLKTLSWPDRPDIDTPRTGMGSPENPNCISKTDVLMPTLELASMFAKRLSKPGKSPSSKALGMKLCKENNTYTGRYYSILLKNWKKGTGRFQAYGKRFDPSTGTATSHSAGYQETLRADQVPNTDVADTSSETNGSVSNASRKQSLSTEDMIKIFQNHESFTKQGNSLTQLGEMLKLEYGKLDAAKWSKRFQQWTEKKGRFADLPEALPAEPATSLANPDVISSGSLGPRSSQGGRRTPYTEAEEMQMARYIVGRLPQETKSRPQDWEDYQKQYPLRSLAAYVERHRGHRERIDGMARGIQAVAAVDKGKDRAISVESDDSSVIALNPPLDREERKFVDMTGLNSDDE